MDRLQIYRKLVFSFFCVLFYKQEVNAQMDYSDVMLNIGDANYGIFDGEASYDEEKALNHIRRERFYLILPSVMREAKVDMWIHVAVTGSDDTGDGTESNPYTSQFRKELILQWNMIQY